MKFLKNISASMKSKNVFCIFLYLYVIFLHACVNANELKFVALEVAPWAYRNSAGGFSGAFIDIVHEIEKETGYEIKVTLAPFGFSRIIRELEAGRQDCTMIIQGKKGKYNFFG